MFDNIFGIHEQALLLHGQRVGVLATNLANADTPNYKARDIDFSAVLAHTDAAPLPLRRQPTARTSCWTTRSAPSADLKYRNPFQASLDGNTVEMPVEQAAFAGEQRALSGEPWFHQRKNRGADARHQRPVAVKERTMSLFNVFNIAGSALNAETIRLNTTASNLANAESVNGDPSKIYRARHPVFQTMMDNSAANFDEEDAACGRAGARRGRKHRAALDALSAGQSRGEQGWLCLQFERQFDRRDDQHDLGQPHFRHQRRRDQYGAGFTAQNHCDGPLGGKVSTNAN